MTVVVVVVIVELELVEDGDWQYWLVEERSGNSSDSVGARGVGDSGGW